MGAVVVQHPGAGAGAGIGGGGSIGPRLVHIGVDIGQKQDPTAIVVCQVLERLGKPLPPAQQPSPRDDPRFYRQPQMQNRPLETYYEARHIERLRLGTGYPQVAERIAQVATSPVLGGARILLAVDVTGVGQPVYEMVRDAVSVLSGGKGTSSTPGIRMRPITFTHGDRYDRAAGRLGKAYLVSRLQALLQTGCIKLPPRHTEAQQMARELKDYEIRVDSATANDTYGAFKVGTHDDLATALGLAVLDDPRTYRVSIGPRLF